MNRAPRLSLGRRLLGTVAALASCGVLLALIHMPGADGAYTAKVANSANMSASNPYFTCTAAARGEGLANRATFVYPFSQTKGTTATDVSANGKNGTYTASGVTHGGTGGACARDGGQFITLDGVKCYVSGPSAQVASPGPGTFSIEIWFRTNTGGGKLIGFGNNRTGASDTYDRHLYLDNSGHVVFGVFPNAVKTVISPDTYADNQWHQAVATLSPTTANAPKGMALYVDGDVVDSDTSVTTAQSYAGYWRIGYDNLNGWGTSQPSNSYFKGQLAFATAYNTYGLSAAQVAQHFAAGD